jgi:hypothetical protein
LVKLTRILAWLQPATCSSGKDTQYITKLAGYTDRLLQIFPANPKGNCLPRSLILFRFARQQGFLVVFHCGVRRSEFGLDGHAWLTLRDEPFLENSRQHEEMVKTVSFPAV